MAADNRITHPDPPPENISLTVSVGSLLKSVDGSILDNIPIPRTELQQNSSASNSNLEKTKEDSIPKKEIPIVVDQDSENSKEDESKHPSKLNLVFITGALCLSIFCVGLDNTILATATPKITDQFHSLDDLGWYGSAYLLTTSTFQLIFGKLYTFYSIKWVYLVALFIFELGSLLCGVAPNSTTLIVGRAVAGIGSAGVVSGGFLIITHLVSLRRRPTYTGVIGSMYGMACVTGPLLGGVFTDNPKLTWRWCFYINLPIGLVTAIFVALFVTSLPRNTADRINPMNKLKQMDIPGTICFLPGVVCLLLALQWGGTKYQWNNARIVALIVVAGVLLVGFIVIQVLSGENATVRLRVIKNRNVWGAIVFGACGVGAFYIFLFYIPIWFQAVKNVSPVKSGVMNLPMLLGFVIFSVVGGSLVSIIGYYIPFVYLTIIFMSVGGGLLATLKVDSGHPEWIGYQFLFGAGSGICMQQTMVIVQTALPLKDIPIGTAIIIFSQNLTAAIMVSVAQNVFTNQLVKNLSHYVPSLDSSIVLTAGATQIKSQVPEEFYGPVLVAYNKSLTQTFYVGVALSCCAIFGLFGIQPLSVKEKRIDTTQVA